MSETAAVCIIGAEVLSGKVADQNGPYLITEFRRRGIQLRELRVIEDNVDTIAASISELTATNDHVVTTGGIGPTHDDLTIDGVALAYGVPVVEDPSLLELLEARGPLSPTRRRLARVPEGSTLYQTNGTLPVIVKEKVCVLPGVPSFMRIAFEHVASRFNGRAFVTRELAITAYETDIADVLDRAQAQNAGVEIGSYPQFSSEDHWVRITFDGQDDDRVRKAHADVKKSLSERLGPQRVR